jgi:hypothetical protein
MDIEKQKQINLDTDSINLSDSITVTSGVSDDLTWLGTSDLSYGAVPLNGQSNISIAPSIWTTTGTSGHWTITESDLISPNSGQLQLNGEDADIRIGEKSLMQILDGIEQRLGLLQLRPDLEREWEDLKALGDQYRELVKNIEEKSKMWETLKKMPPPPKP